MTSFFRLGNWKHIDWILLGALLPILGAGLVTVSSFGVSLGAGLFGKQLIWIAISFVILFVISLFDFRVFQKTQILVALYLFSLVILVGLFIFGSTIKGATSWYSFGSFSFQPADVVKVVLILMLAKYFSRRHVEIANIKHIFISGLYALIPFALILLQPDFGTAVIVVLVWFGMALISGINKKHLFLVIGAVIVAIIILWSFVFQPYQKDRLKTFLNPLSDIQGAGYNAYQSTIAVGSGQLLGKGVGYGTQSRLQFLPEYETDFVFAAFAEEWGFVGSTLILLCYGIVIWRILRNASHGRGNFEILFCFGVAIMLMSHIIINIGMNIGLLPVTGITLPFMSYGGSHLLAEFIAFGILMGMRRDARDAHPDDIKHEFLGY